MVTAGSATWPPALASPDGAAAAGAAPKNEAAGAAAMGEAACAAAMGEAAGAAAMDAVVGAAPKGEGAVLIRVLLAASM